MFTHNFIFTPLVSSTAFTLKPPRPEFGAGCEPLRRLPCLPPGGFQVPAHRPGWLSGQVLGGGPPTSALDKTWDPTSTPPPVPQARPDRPPEMFTEVPTACQTHSRCWEASSDKIDGNPVRRKFTHGRGRHLIYE